MDQMEKRAKGYSQVAEIDYQETFAPTAGMRSVRMLMHRAVQNNMITPQMDVKTSYPYKNIPILFIFYIYFNAISSIFPLFYFYWVLFYSYFSLLGK